MRSSFNNIRKPPWSVRVMLGSENARVAYLAAFAKDSPGSIIYRNLQHIAKRYGMKASDVMYKCSLPTIPEHRLTTDEKLGLNMIRELIDNNYYIPGFSKLEIDCLMNFLCCD